MARGAPIISLARPGDQPDVEAFVEAQASASIYHRPAFLRVIERAGGLATALFVARRPALVGILPVALTRSILFGNCATSLPYFNYGGVLVAPGEETVAAALVKEAWAWAQEGGGRHLTLRHTEDRPLALPVSRRKETLTLPLPPGDPDALWRAIGPKPRNLVRKAEKAGLTVRGETGPAALRAFHRVLSENMRDLGSPAHGLQFYEVLLDEVGAAAELHVVRLPGGDPAAAALTLRFRDRVEVPWASSLRRYSATAANMLLYWHLLRQASRKGARTFDFGRSSPGSGPYRFKLQWGARPEPLPWYYVAADGMDPAASLAPTNPRYARAIRLWRCLPVSVTRALGARLARSLP